MTIMITVTFVDHDGATRTVEVAEGTSVMAAAVDHGVPGIDGDCGGNCICGTCHVFVAPEWRAAAGGRNGQEAEMVELIEGSDGSSRLGCQIRLTPAHDGIVVRTPRFQQ
jgi:2Fe-2S ferredoxin